jgi:hypothetical protein
MVNPLPRSQLQPQARLSGHNNLYLQLFDLRLRGIQNDNSRRYGQDYRLKFYQASPWIGCQFGKIALIFADMISLQKPKKMKKHGMNIKLLFADFL